MALFSKKVKPQSSTQGNVSLTDIVSGLVKRWSKTVTRDKSELPDLAMKNPRLDPVSIIAKSIAGTEFLLYDKRELRVNPNHAEPIADSPIYDLLDTPIKRYPEIDGYSLKFLTSALVDLTGEFFWWKCRDDAGNIEELYPIPPSWIQMTPTINNPYFMMYPMGVTSGNSIPVSPDDMVYFKRSDFVDPYGRGRGTSEAIIDEVESDEKAAKSQKYLFENDCTPPYVITAPGMPQDQADAFKASWKQKLGGFMHRREPGVIGFDAKILQLGMTPLEMDMIESRKYLRDESLQHYQLPPEIYGVIENSNRSTIDASYYLYHRNVLGDRYRFVERAINRQLIATDFDKNIIGKFKEIIPEDEEFKLKVVTDGATAGLLTRRVWKTTMGFEADDRDDVYVIPFSLYEAPANKPIEPANKPSGSGGSTVESADDELSDAADEASIAIDEKPIEEASKAIFAMIKKSREIEDVKKKTITIVSENKEAVTKSQKNKARREAIWKAFDSRATAKEGMFIEAVKKYSEGQKPRVVSALSSLDSSIESGKGYDKAIDSALDSVFNEKANKALKSALAPAWLDTMASGRDHFYDMIDGNKAAKAPKVNPSLAVTNKLFQAWVEENGLLRAVGINDTTNERLRAKLSQAISDGIANGDTLNTIKNSILDVCDSLYYDLGADTNLDAAKRAKLIARNESMVSTNFGATTTASTEGMTRKEWLSTNDSRTRGSDPKDEFDHIEPDGQIVGIDEPFIVNGESLMFPGDSSLGASAGNTIQCRCSVLFGNSDIPLGEDEGE